MATGPSCAAAMYAWCMRLLAVAVLLEVVFGGARLRVDANVLVVDVEVSNHTDLRAETVDANNPCVLEQESPTYARASNGSSCSVRSAVAACVNARSTLANVSDSTSLVLCQLRLAEGLHEISYGQIDVKPSTATNVTLVGDGRANHTIVAARPKANITRLIRVADDDTASSNGTYAYYRFLNVKGSTLQLNLSSLVLQDFSLRDESDGAVLYVGQIEALYMERLLVRNNLNSVATRYTDGSSGNGGVMYVRGCSFTRIVDSQFLNNTVHLNGGKGGVGVFFQDSGKGVSMRVVLENCYFSENRAGYAGAIRFRSVSHVIVRGCTAVGNHASKHNGGVFHMDEHQRALISNCTFLNNTAGESGGAVYASDITNFFMTHCTFADNSASFDGGAVTLLDMTNHVTRILYSTFVHNTAYRAGGAVYLGSMWVPFKECTFVGNLAFPREIAAEAKAGTNSSAGGAIFASAQSIITLTDCLFDSNAASEGGAVSIIDTSELHIEGGSFVNNQAVYSIGGALTMGSFSLLRMSETDLVNNSAAMGGAAGIVYQAFAVMSSVSFVNNVALSGGGGLAVSLDSTAECTNCVLHGNSAVRGGAIMADNGARLVLENADVRRNTATIGGALFSSAISAVVVSNTLFDQNSADKFGGAASFETQLDDVVQLFSGVTLRDNTARSAGGALYLFELSSFSLLDSFLIGNRATLFGGAVAVTSATGLVLHNTTLTNNSVPVSATGYGEQLSTADPQTGSASTTAVNVGHGGAVSFDDGEADIANCAFLSNTVFGSGGAINSAFSVLRVTNSTLDRNEAAVYGGGLFITDSSNVSLTSSVTFGHNQAQAGGAIFWTFQAGQWEPDVLAATESDPNYALYGPFIATPASNITANMPSSEQTSGEVIRSPVPRVALVDWYGNVTRDDNHTTIRVRPYDVPHESNPPVAGGATTETVEEGVALFDDLVVQGEVGDTVALRFSATLDDGRKLETTGSVSMRACGPGEELTTKGQICETCAEGFYTLVPGAACKACPDGASCPGGDQIYVKKGYWRVPETDTVLQCPIRDACAGGNDTAQQCAKGYWQSESNTYCYKCDYSGGYARPGPAAACHSCRANWRPHGRAVASVVVILFGIRNAMDTFGNTPTDTLAPWTTPAFSYCISFFQQVNLLAGYSAVAASLNHLGTLVQQSTALLNVDMYFDSECREESDQFLNSVDRTLLLGLSIPVLFVVWVLVWCRSTSAWGRKLAFLLLSMDGTLTLPVLVTAVGQTWATCHKIPALSDQGADQFLTVDYTIECDNDRLGRQKILGLVLVAVIALGFFVCISVTVCESRWMRSAWKSICSALQASATRTHDRVDPYASRAGYFPEATAVPKPPVGNDNDADHGENCDQENNVWYRVVRDVVMGLARTVQYETLPLAADRDLFVFVLVLKSVMVGVTTTLPYWIEGYHGQGSAPILGTQVLGGVVTGTFFLLLNCCFRPLLFIADTALGIVLDSLLLLVYLVLLFPLMFGEQLGSRRTDDVSTFCLALVCMALVFAIATFPIWLSKHWEDICGACAAGWNWLFCVKSKNAADGLHEPLEPNNQQTAPDIDATI